MIRIFTKQKQELTSDINTWIVKYITYKNSGIGVKYPSVEECYQAFTDENEAKEYVKRLKDAIKVLRITSLPEPKMYLQDKNSL